MGKAYVDERGMLLGAGCLHLLSFHELDERLARCWRLVEHRTAGADGNANASAHMLALTLGATNKRAPRMPAPANENGRENNAGKLRQTGMSLGSWTYEQRLFCLLCCGNAYVARFAGTA